MMLSAFLPLLELEREREGERKREKEAWGEGLANNCYDLSSTF